MYLQISIKDSLFRVPARHVIHKLLNERVEKFYIPYEYRWLPNRRIFGLYEHTERAQKAFTGAMTNSSQ